MKSLKELRELKEKALDTIKARNAGHENTVKVHVGMGTCGIASGARETFMTLLNEINKENLQNVSLTQVGCMGNCFEEPVVRITYPGQEPKNYVKVDAKKAKEIINEIKGS